MSLLKQSCQRFFGHDFAFRKKNGFSVPFGDWCSDPRVWRGYVDRLDVDWLGSLVDPTPVHAHQAMLEGKAKWSQQNLNMIFSLTQLQAFYSIFIASDRPTAPAAWQAIVPQTS